LPEDALGRDAVAIEPERLHATRGAVEGADGLERLRLIANREVAGNARRVELLGVVSRYRPDGHESIRIW
jgi:hypothetical protein